MGIIKKLFGIKTTYAIPSDNGVDITKGKKYEVISFFDGAFVNVKDNSKTKIFCLITNCKHINGGSWEIITE